MKEFKLNATEAIETIGMFEFPDGPVTVIEREVHEFYTQESKSETRLIVSDAIGRTRDFISKARAEFSELNSVMRELTAK